MPSTRALPSPRHRSPAWLWLLLAMLALQGCGVRYATVRTDRGEDLMLLGHDPVAYFTVGKPVRGDPRFVASHEGVVYYFASDAHRQLFAASPAKYAPQYGGFCADGVAYGVKMGSDPTEFAIRDGRLFIFGDVVGREFWLLRPDWDIEHADRMWPETSASGHRWQSIKRLVFRVPWYKTGREIVAEWQAKYPNRRLDYDPGGIVQNLIFKYPGWRAREGHMQPALGVPGMDPCPPACIGEVSRGYVER
jgi:YHS domain-containing protein